VNQDQRNKLLGLAKEVAEDLKAKVTAIGNAVGDVSALKDQIEQAKIDAEEERDAEQEKYDNLPDGFKEGEKGQAMQEAISFLDTAMQKLEEAAEAIGEFGEKLETAETALDEANDNINSAASV
jgi:flagellin-like hook-associated protein FlgL